MGIEKYGFSQNWVKIGLIDLNEFPEQEKKFLSNSDNSYEHFRYELLESYLYNKSSFSDNEIHILLDLLQFEQDITMSQTFTFQLYKSTKVTLVQKELIGTQLSKLSEWGNKIVEREKITSSLKNMTEVNQEFFSKSVEFYIKYKDKVVIEFLIKYCNDQDQLKELLKLGLSKKLRNQLELILNSNKSSL
ncbi:hypothetical protein [Flammeovirga agarivorans]|uniref:Uncharacterized protein n=1 Tax=Flammeovirga agarivorans TaxID=2726742 RepID=A0A7X8XZD6_9BACT|nr:hypothetical protein [Flammeovirga agarivorans]NLR95072.1 hypothetical protein [Flammeovirga agarivorans]